MLRQDDIELIRLLTSSGVPIVVIGGHAVNAHGYVRATEDVDVVWLHSPESEAALLPVLQSVHAATIGDEIDPATGMERLIPVSPHDLRSSHLLMLVTDFGFLDLFDYIPGHPNASVQELFEQSVVHLGIRFASREWLVKMKRAAGRPKDLLDLANLPEGEA